MTIAQKTGRASTAREIATATHVPSAYLSKLMQSLVRGGIVTAQRGPNGGFQLVKSPEELTLWEVVDVLEPFQRIRTCPLGIRTHTGQLCPLHQNLDNAMATAEKMFREMTVAQMLAAPGGVTPLCEDSPEMSLQSLGIPTAG